MDELEKKYEDIKTLLTRQAAPVLGETLLVQFLAVIEDYQKTVKQTLQKQAQHTAAAREENNLLRDLVGGSDTAQRAKLISQAEEIRILRMQLAQVQGERNTAKAGAEELRLELERSKLEFQEQVKRHEFEQHRYEENLAKVKQELASFGASTRTLEERTIKERSEEHKQALLNVEQNEKDVRREVEQELRSIVSRLRNLCGAVMGTAQFCVERWGKIRAEYAASRAKLSKEDESLLSESVPDLDLIFHNSQEVIKILDIYLQILNTSPVQLASVEWLKFWQGLRQKMTGPYVRLPVRVIWPTQKEFPPFQSDEKIIEDICTLLLQNCTATAPQGGVLEVGGEFSYEKAAITFSYKGPALDPEERKNLFIPFSDTKFGHKGLQLSRAIRLARRLGGTITYDMPQGVHVFTVVIPAPKNGTVA